MTIELIVRETRIQGGRKIIKEEGIISFDDSKCDLRTFAGKIRALVSQWTIDLALKKKSSAILKPRG